jgi:hypothetical protein
MTGRHNSVSQAVRLSYLIGYLAFLFVINRFAFGQWVPPTTSKGLWFYSGAAALILGSLLVTPFFTSPANAVSYLVAALVAVFAYAAPSSDLKDTLPRNTLIVFCFGMLAACGLNICFKGSKKRRLHNISEAGRILADDLGSPRFVYAVVIVYSLWEYHRASPAELFFVSTAGIVIAAQQPLETLGSLVRRIRELWIPAQAPAIIGSVVAHQAPGVLLIRQEGTESIAPGSCLLVADEHAQPAVAVALGYYGRDEGILLRALEITVPGKNRARLLQLAKGIPEDCASLLGADQVSAFADDVYLLRNLKTFVGIVAPDTSTERLYFEVIQERDIEQGRLVEAFVGGSRVLYQVLDGLTKEEAIQQKNTYGFARGEAAQIGVWDEAMRKFKPCNWIPKLNAPVFLKTVEKPLDNAKAVGHFPSTSYDVEIKSLDELVTHNTAILGILGVGKSMLGIELVERMIAHGIKVVCIDLTNQYATELAAFLSAAHEEECLNTIQAAGQQDRRACADNPEEGGSLRHLREAILNDLAQFLREESPWKLKIYNPAELSATRQDQEPRSFNVGGVWHRSAGLWQVTPVEMTCVITECCLSLLHETMTDKARVCLVFEEAHALVPERNFITVEGDQRAASGTARAILQGRKFGLGCLLVTQRTANVSKTILNQCNTIFAMRTFDETGKDFLSNYISLKYATKLPTLQERQAVFFGRGSSCENPVMIRLNDRQDFLRLFRPAEPQQPAGAPRPASGTGEANIQ